MAGQFELDLSRFAAKAQGRMDLVVQKVCLDIFAKVIMRTPVDTGRARGAWSCQIGELPTGEPGTVDRSGSQAMQRVTSIVGTAKAGNIVCLANNVPYILMLEYGSSKQAPQGMLNATLREFKYVVDKSVTEASQK